jgi:hypothetical protein
MFITYKDRPVYDAKDNWHCLLSELEDAQR